MTRVAAIDCGTNSLRLLVADVDADAGTLTDVDRRTEIVRLGEGVDGTGRIAPGGPGAHAGGGALLRRRGRRGAGAGGPGRRHVRRARRRRPGRVLARDAGAVRRRTRGRQRRRGGGSRLRRRRPGGRRSRPRGAATSSSTSAAARPRSSSATSTGRAGVAAVPLGRRRVGAPHRAPPAQRPADGDGGRARPRRRRRRPRRGGVRRPAGAHPHPGRGRRHRHHRDRARPGAARRTTRARSTAPSWRSRPSAPPATTCLHRSRAQRAELPYLETGRVDVIGAGALLWGEIVDRVQREAGITSVVASEHDVLDGIAWSLATPS